MNIFLKKTAAGGLSFLFLMLNGVPFSENADISARAEQSGAVTDMVFGAAQLDSFETNGRETDDDPSYFMDYSDIDEAVGEMTESDISFSQLVGRLLSGEMDFSLKSIASWTLKKIFDEVVKNRSMMLQMAAIAVIGAAFTGLSEAFSGKYAAETGFYLTYMLMFSLLGASFAVTADIAVKTADRLIRLMQVIVPAFCTAVTLALGVTTSHAWYQLLMMLVVAVDWVMAGFLMRFIKIYVVLSMVNQMTGEDYFSKMGELFKTAVEWSLRAILGVTLGLNLIQNMVLPAFDSVKNGVMTKVSAVLPGVGDALGAAAKAAIGSGVLLKNAVGTAGVIVIIVVCALPLIQLLAVALMYKILEVLIQPISDQRLTSCVHAAGDGVMLLLKTCSAVILLFVISLAMMTLSSNTALSA